ncbi:hypothetical protein [Eggerthella sinensis]|uniref:hypothetical protein n=1 Tax=Eggerthella sinensis TaxID=242230 RepID=UPI0022E70A4B|nr:hypothetical protein [Eggerthella sinensis]
MPQLKFFGFGFWVAWFGVAYKSSVWVDGVEATASVVSDMFFASTVAHAVTLLLFAALSKRTAAIAQRPWFVMGGGVAAAWAACSSSWPALHSFPRVPCSRWAARSRASGRRRSA